MSLLYTTKRIIKNQIFTVTTSYSKNDNKKQSKGEWKQLNTKICETKNYIQTQKSKSILKVSLNNNLLVPRIKKSHYGHFSHQHMHITSEHSSEHIKPRYWHHADTQRRQGNV